MGCHHLKYQPPEPSSFAKEKSFFRDVLGQKSTPLKKRSDYLAFGMQMPGRYSSSGDYRYGFNGYEKDDDIKGSGNSYTTLFRQHTQRHLTVVVKFL